MQSYQHNHKTAANPVLLACLLAVVGQAPALAQTPAPQQTPAERERQAAVTEVWQQVPQVKPGPLPSDAIDLSSLTSWRSVQPRTAPATITASKPATESAASAAPWQAEQGGFTVKPGSGDIETVQAFCDIQLHLQWRTPAVVGDKQGQLRNNSGVFLQSRYEIQILDSYQNPTYSNGQAAAIYKQVAPLVNASHPSGEWQSYDIIYRAPRFNGERLSSPALVTVLHNGILVQDHSQIHGVTEWIGAPSYQAHGCAPLKLQDHGDAVSFRNIWVRPL